MVTFSLGNSCIDTVWVSQLAAAAQVASATWNFTESSSSWSTTPSANWGAIMSHYFYFDILYQLWHYYVLLWHYYITYFFANVRTIIFHYFIISKKTIISLMTLLLFHLFVSTYFNAIIAIMTLLFALFLLHNIMTIIFFQK